MAAVAIAAGAAGVIATSAFYGLSPPQAALPMPDPMMVQASDAAATGAALLKAGGTIGIVSDVVLVIGALVLMARRTASEDGLERLGWAGIAVSALVFVTVDAMAGYVLPEVAVMPNGAAAFAGFKRLFDVLFVLGTLAFGAAMMAIFWNERRSGARILGTIGFLTGLLATIVSCAYFIGVNLAQPIGISVAVGSVLFTLLGVQLAMRAANAPALIPGASSP
ncbi:MAG: hypothetical protein ABSG76_09695 [Xanthobacteraceae bacterium]